MADSPELHICLLGGFTVRVARQPVPNSVWRQKRAAAIVKLLALEPTHRLHREQLADSQWPEHDPEAAANNLRVALHHARQGLHSAGAPAGLFLERSGDVISLGPAERVHVDIAAFGAALQSAWRSPEPAVSQAAIDLYSGDLLPEDPYEDWASGQRTALRTSYLTLLRRLALLHEQRGELGQAIVVCQRSLSAEPLDEEAQATVIRLFALSGQHQQALAQYDRLAALLDQELGDEPQATTQALITSIREGRFPQTALPLEPAVPSAADEAQPRPRGLPAPLDALIGREREEAELRHLLSISRLVTLTGPGGVGKTRLALAVAHGAAAAFPDGAVFADLAALDDHALVLPTVASACGVREEAGRSLQETLHDHLHARRMLLLIDNMEHLTPAAAELGQILAACPLVKILVTSRTRLRLHGEQEYPLPPLAVPEAVEDVHAGSAGWTRLALPSAALADIPAVALFTRRAQAARPDFALHAGNIAAVAEICRRLDGLPLALELAAARVRVLAPAELLAHLEHPLQVLTGGPRDLPDRQRTLRATIAWSHDLLSPEEQDLFARLSVFAGGCSLDAAARVMGSWGDRVLGAADHDGRHEAKSALPSFLTPHDPITPSPSSTLDIVSSLIDQSLLQQATGRDGTSRVRMLETIREYARERLEFSGAAEAAQRRHAAYFLTLAEDGALELEASGDVVWLNRLEVEHDNLRQALRTFHEQQDGEHALRLAAALWRFWWQRGYFSEGRQHLALALALAASDTAAGATRATAHDGAGALAEAQADLAAAAVHHEAALRLRRALGDRRGEARSLIDFGIIADQMGDAERAIQLFSDGITLARDIADRMQLASGLANLGFVLAEQGRNARALQAFEESLGLFRELEDQRNLCYVLGGMANLAFLAGDYAGAAALQGEALRVLRELGDRQGMADGAANLAHVVQQQGDFPQAAVLYSEALDRYRELGNPSGAAFVLIHFGRLHRLLGDSAQANALLREGYQLAWQIGEKPMLTEAIEGLAEVACDSGEPALCARLLGAAQALREETAIPLPAVHAPAIAHCLATARAALGDTAFAAALGAGRAMSAEGHRVIGSWGHGVLG